MALTVAAARESRRAEMIPLVVLTLMDSTTVRISDRVKEVDGNTYDRLFFSQTTIQEIVSRLDSVAMNPDYSMVLLNIPVVVAGTEYNSLLEANDAHPLNGALVQLSYVFVLDGETSPATLVFTGVAEEPTNITKATLTIRCTGLPEYLAKSFSLEKMLAADYVLSLPSDSGKVFPYVYGWFHELECIRTVWPVFATDNETLLDGAITSSSTTITVDSTVGFGDGADEEKIIWIEWERIGYANKDDATRQFLGCTRGLTGSVSGAQAHADNVRVSEYPHYTAEVEVCAHESSGIDSIYGEYEGYLAKIETVDIHYDAARTYVWIDRDDLVVPQSIIDLVGWSGVPTMTEFPAQNGGFSTDGTANGQKTFTWPANPFLKTRNGVAYPQYTQCAIKLVYDLPNKRGFESYPTGAPFYQEAACQLDYNRPWEPTIPAVRLMIGRTRYYWSNDPSPVHWSSYAILTEDFGYGGVYTLAVDWQLWGTPITVYFNSGCRANIREAHGPQVTAFYSCLLNANAGTDDKYFRRIYASGWGRNSLAAETGTVGTPILNPSDIMRSWIVEKIGHAWTDIDDASFDAARTFYASNAMRLTVRVRNDIDPLERLYRMAFESRSVVYFALGKWYLKVIPSTAPSVADMVIDATDLERKNSASFTPGYTKRDDVVNKLVVKWDQNNGPTKDESPYHQSFTVSDVVGDYPDIEKTLELEMVGTNALDTSVPILGLAHAQGVAEIYLKQRNRVFKTVEFSVFWQNTALSLGDTIQITGGDWWEGVKFWVTSVTREGIGKATYTAVEWW